jgi:hypothetical protein
LYDHRLRITLCFHALWGAPRSKKKRGALQLLALSHMEINAEGHHQHVGGSVICRMMEQNS